jgi:predicted alpha/beta-hydrolase family hydrolase
MWVAEKPDAWDGGTAVILAHGAGQGMDSPFMTYFHHEMASRGFLSVKFNFDYMNQRRGVPDPQPKLRAQYRTVIDGISAEYHPKRIIIGGKSMGGRVASYIAGNVDAVAGLVFLGYPLHAPGKTNQLRDEHLYSLMRPMLFISGTRDTLAEQSLLQRVVNKIGERATIVWIERGDHSLTVRRGDTGTLKIAADRMEEWIRKV